MVVCTGYEEFDAARVKQYGYGRLPDVITSFELEAMLRRGRVETKAGARPRHVAIIHCVGSRSREFHAYCSRVCCMTGLKYANEIRSAIPEAYVSDLYTDMSAFGKGCEDFYKKTAEARTVFLMYEKNHAPGDPPGRAGSGLAACSSPWTSGCRARRSRSRPTWSC